MLSDATLERFAFSGPGACYLEKTDEGYKVDLLFMEDYEVEDGLEPFGACAHFDNERKVQSITHAHRSFGKKKDLTARPGDGKPWEMAKYAFRASAWWYMTLVSHGLFTHIIASNTAIIAAKTELPPEHPLRRLVHPFQFRGILVNFKGSKILFNQNGIFHRGGMTWNGILKMLTDAVNKHFIYESFPEFLARNKLECVSGDDYPYGEDGLAFWNILHKFITEYLEFYFKDKPVDKEAGAFWAALSEMMPGDILKNKKGSWEDIRDYLCWVLFMCTAYHAHVGNGVDYIMDPYFVGNQIRMDVPSSGPLNSTRMALLSAVTGYIMPPLIDEMYFILRQHFKKDCPIAADIIIDYLSLDFTHLLLKDPEVYRISKEFLHASMDLSAEIEAKNATTRREPFQNFNPRNFNISVAI